MTQYDVIQAQFFASLALQVVIVVAMVRKRLYLQARYFFAYVVWQTFSVSCMYLIQLKAPVSWYFFYSYWINDAIDIILAVAILVEIFNRIFALYEGIRQMARIFVLWTSGLLIVISSVFLFYHHAEYSMPILTFVLVTERSVRIFQLGLILALFAITRYLHIRWKNYLFGIALGFGFYALTVLAVLIVRMTYGLLYARLTNTLQGFGYVVAVVIWTAYVLQPEAASVPIVSLPSDELEKWDEALKRMLGRPTAETCK